MYLLFDCDGVVLDSMPLHNRAESELFARCGIHIAPDELARRFSGVPQKRVNQILCAEQNATLPDDFETALEAQKTALFDQFLQPVDGIGATLDALSDVPKCIASGTETDLLRHMLTLTNLYDRFAPHVYSSQQVARGKPFPDLFEFSARQLGPPSPDVCVVIEDGIPGVQAGVAAGMRVLGFTGGGHCGPEHADALRAAGATLVFDRMTDLPAVLKTL